VTARYGRAVNKFLPWPNRRPHFRSSPEPSQKVAEQATIIPGRDERPDVAGGVVRNVGSMVANEPKTVVTPAA
jgi:hypothetical protein